MQPVQTEPPEKSESLRGPEAATDETPISFPTESKTEEAAPTLTKEDSRESTSGQHNSKPDLKRSQSHLEPSVEAPASSPLKAHMRPSSPAHKSNLDTPSDASSSDGLGSTVNHNSYQLDTPGSYSPERRAEKNTSEFESRIRKELK